MKVVLLFDTYRYVCNVSKINWVWYKGVGNSIRWLTNHTDWWNLKKKILVWIEWHDLMYSHQLRDVKNRWLQVTTIDQLSGTWSLYIMSTNLELWDSLVIHQTTWLELAARLWVIYNNIRVKRLNSSL